MTIADKLTLLASSKEALRVKLGLPKNLPFSEYYKYALTHPDTAILALFKDGKQGVWYDPSDKSTLFQDVAGTVPVTKDGDPVALMKDKSGNGNHAKQTVSTARPIYKTDGILHWFETDGIDDTLLSPNFLVSRSNFVLCLAAERQSGGILLEYGAGDISVFAGNTSAAGRGWQINHKDDKGVGYGVIHYPDYFDGSKSVILFEANNLIKRTSIDGKDIVTQTKSTFAGTFNSKLSVGARQATTLPCKSRVYSIIITEYADGTANKLVAYSAAKSGVIL